MSCQVRVWLLRLHTHDGENLSEHIRRTAQARPGGRTVSMMQPKRTGAPCMRASSCNRASR